MCHGGTQRPLRSGRGNARNFVGTEHAPCLRMTRARGLLLASLLGLLHCSADGAAPFGDGLDLAPPAHGVQLKTPRFDVPAGTETQHCYWFKLPSDVDLDVVRIQVRYLAGSHHMNLFQTNQDVPDHDEECFMPMNFSSPTNPDGYDLVVGSQGTALDWKLPDGVAFKLKAHRQLLLQTHYVNATTQKTPANAGQVKVNLEAEPDRSKVVHHMGTMFANNMTIKIPPRESRSFSTTCGLDKDVSIVALTGHFHSRGRTFSVNAAPDGKNPAEEMYRSRAWAEPPFQVLAAPRVLPAGGSLYYTCDYQNDTDQEIVFGPKVETMEHCNLFAYFYPWEEDHARYCF